MTNHIAKLIDEIHAEIPDNAWDEVREKMKYEARFTAYYYDTAMRYRQALEKIGNQSYEPEITRLVRETLSE